MFYILASTLYYVNEKSFTIKNPFLKYYKSATTKCNVILKIPCASFEILVLKKRFTNFIYLSTTFFKLSCY